jgi:glyceraldehyde 3-phosphate dehydrogenase
MTTAGINGFGRFALNLLWSWFRDVQSPYRIAYINDETLTPAEILRILKTDSLVQGFQKCKVVLQPGNTLLIQDPSGRTVHIVLSNSPAEQVSWLGTPDLLLECSGKRSASAELCQPFLVGKTKTVIVSATCYDADATLVVGFNHESYDPKAHRVVSYGSCTVNPGVTLTNFMHQFFGVDECVVGVVHNVQKHRLDAREFHTLQRKFCTLEVMAPKMLPFLTKDNFTVNYTVVPWEGASIIDFAFRLKTPGTKSEVLGALKRAMAEGGALDGLLGMVPDDMGPEAHIGSPYSAVIVESQVKMVGPTLHLFCYFYNEGSAIRLHELAKYISTRL